MGDRTRVLVVAGNRLLREALARVLKKRGDFLVTATPYSDDLIQVISTDPEDVIILDSVTVSLAGHDFVRDVARVEGATRVLLVGMPKDEHLFLNSVRAGVRGYVLEDASSADVLSAVRAVAEGQSVCPPSLCSALFTQVARPRTEMPSIQVRVRLGLTRREQQLIPLIAQGFTNKEIATNFRISEQTVKNHIHRMLQKVGANDRMAVVDLCRSHGFDIL